jgi:hypothetical protein
MAMPRASPVCGISSNGLDAGGAVGRQRILRFEITPAETQVIPLRAARE